jgi:hypothetical protein
MRTEPSGEIMIFLDGSAFFRHACKRLEKKTEASRPRRFSADRQHEGSAMHRYDNLEIRCPRLGHELKFSYCRRESGDLPCHRTIRCWQPFFPVEAYLGEILSAAEWERFSRQGPGDKMTTLIDLIERAKSRGKGKA